MKKLKKFFRYFFIVIGALILSGILWFTIRKPTNDRDWSLDQKILAYADIKDNIVTIHNVRNFRYKTTDDYTPGYYDRIYDLNKIKQISYVVEPFSDLAGPAHTFMTFEFEGNNFVSISIEIRKRAGKTFNEVLSALNYYELMYVIADERDVVALRSNYRHDMVYMYPMKTSKEDAAALFLDMVKRANKLKNEPEFYNLFLSSCTTNIVDHVNKLRNTRIPYGLKIWLPSYSDQLAYDLGLIDTDLPLQQARNKFFINQRAEKYENDPNFSAKIRNTNL